MRNVVMEGADPTGVRDNTDLLERLHRQAAKAGESVYYPNGIYRYNGEYLDLSSGIEFESIGGVILKNDISVWNLFQHDSFGNFIGLIQNPMEKGEKELKTSPYSSGYLMDAPLYDGNPRRKVDCLAWWYNDFGLECVRQNPKDNGWIGWYYWDWNHHDCLKNAMPGGCRHAYDPSRHPLLGFYKGDDPKVLDWITYWLLQYGVNAVGLLSVVMQPFDSPVFDYEREDHKDHWLYVLLNQVKNFKKMKFVMSPEIYYPAKAGVIDWKCRNNKAYIMDLIDKTYVQHPENIYMVTVDGREYPTIFFKEEGAVMWTYDNINLNPVPSGTIALYTEIAGKFKKMGYPGVAVIASVRDSISYLDEHPEALEGTGVVRFHGVYGGTHTCEKADTMEEYVNSFHLPDVNDGRTLTGTFIDLLSHDPHGSHFTTTGHSPKLLEIYMDKAVQQIQRTGAYPAITVHNVSEWAECGPGLIPNMQDGFAYLEAIRKTVLEPER